MTLPRTRPNRPMTWTARSVTRPATSVAPTLPITATIRLATGSRAPSAAARQATDPAARTRAGHTSYDGRVPAVCDESPVAAAAQSVASRPLGERHGTQVPPPVGLGQRKRCDRLEGGAGGQPPLAPRVAAPGRPRLAAD